MNGGELEVTEMEESSDERLCGIRFRRGVVV